MAPFWSAWDCSLCCSVPVTLLAFSIPSRASLSISMARPVPARVWRARARGSASSPMMFSDSWGRADVLRRYEAALFREAGEFMGQFYEGSEEFPLSGLRVALRGAHGLFLLWIEFCGPPHGHVGRVFPGAGGGNPAARTPDPWFFLRA